ncbi:hypothetical protein, partial [Actinoplanes siamensis]
VKGAQNNKGYGGVKGGQAPGNVKGAQNNKGYGGVKGAQYGDKTGGRESVESVGNGVLTGSLGGLDMLNPML